MKVGLALGSGGIIGASWETGALEGIRRVTGFVPAHADKVVGTSAGAFVGSLAFTAGVPLTYHQITSDPVPDVSFSDEQLALARAMDRHNAGGFLARYPLARRFPRPFLASLAGWRRARRGEEGLLLRLASLLWEGLFSTARMGAIVREAWPTGWPSPKLHLATFDLATASTQLLHARAAEPLELATAVSAAVALPGVFSPVRVHGRRLVDAAIWSSAHRKAFLGQGFHTVVCIHPLLGETPPRTRRRGSMLARLTSSIRRRLRARAVAQFERERGMLEREGTCVLSLGPDPEERAAMPRNAMDLASRPMLARAAARATVDKLARREHVRLVDVLGNLSARAVA